LKNHFPFVNDIITHSFFAEVPQSSPWERWILLIFSGFRIDCTIKEPFAVTWGLPEFDGVGVINTEKILVIHER